MRVLNCCVYEGCAGTERAFLDYTQAFLSSGHHVTALVHRKASFIDKLLLPGVDVAMLELNEEYIASDHEKLRELVAAARPDVLITHCPSMVPSLKSAAQGTAPVVFVVHFDYDFCEDGEEETLRQADLVVTLTEIQRQNLIASGWPSDKAAVIPNVIDVPAKPPLFLRPWHNPPVIGTLARLSWEKGVDFLIEAARILKSQGVRCKTLIGGDGQEAGQLVEQARQAGIHEDLVFCEWVDDKPWFYDSIDVYCLPSRFEAFGIVLLEAAVNGRPIVASSCTGAREILANGETGVLVARESPEGLADGLASVLGNKSAADGMATRAFAATAARYDRNRITRRLITRMESLVASFRATGARAP
jgi:glycosyltransferase involved in cell wall biosynthesis